MIGTRQGKFHFRCPFCHAPPGKPCRVPAGPRKGKTCKAHSARVYAYRVATGRERPIVEWLSAYETNRGKH